MAALSLERGAWLMKIRSYLIAAIIGNIFEHYDKFLFCFLAPFLALLFFKSSSQLVALISTFGIMLLGLLSRPLGALFFGRIGDRHGRKRALTLTLLGMALITFCMGCLPTSYQVGGIASLLLALTRLTQNFFASGEVTGGALLILEHCDPKKRTLFSSLYDSSSIIGILIASLSVTLLAEFNSVETHWRILYFAGASTALVGLGIRLFIKEEKGVQTKDQTPTYQMLWNKKFLFLTLCLATGFSHATYESVTTLMNGYLPFVSNLSQKEAVWTGSGILILDLCLLPIFGYLATRIPYQKFMRFFLLVIACLSIPLFCALGQATVLRATIIRVALVLFGVGFAAPFYAWAVETTPHAHRYTLISLSIAFGGQLFGAGGACALSLSLYRWTGWVGAPGIYLAALGLLTYFAMRRLEASQREERVSTVQV